MCVTDKKLLLMATLSQFLFLSTAVDLYFRGKNYLRCSPLETIERPQKIEWFHGDELIYTAKTVLQLNGQHRLNHSSVGLWGGRALFYPSTNSLRLARLTPQDAGQYSCRVEGQDGFVANETFHIKGPMADPQLRVESVTVNGYVNLTAQEIGPLHEDQQLDLFCDGDPAYPQAEVIWHAVNEDHGTLTMPERGKAHLRIERLSRRHNEIKLSCRVEDKATGEWKQSTSVRLSIYFRPLAIAASNNRIHYAWETSELECVVSGSRPAPIVSWLVGGKQFQPTFTHNSFDGNVTTTSLTFEPRPEHHGIAVACQAINPVFPKYILQETWNLIVHYAPVAEIKPCVRTDLSNLDAIKVYQPSELSSFCLRCSILANPFPSSITWLRQGTIIANKSSSTLLQISGPLQKSQEGIYSCHVKNYLGEMKSQPIRVHINCTTSRTTMAINSLVSFSSFILILFVTLGSVAIWRGIFKLMNLYKNDRFLD